jgi:hypothetical protein
MDIVTLFSLISIITEFSSIILLIFPYLISTIRFKEDSRIIVEPSETLLLELVNESPRDGHQISYTLHTIGGKEVKLGEGRDLEGVFEYEIPTELAGSGMAEIVAKSDTGAECSTVIFIK